MIQGIVVIVGRPNVGKSTLFNCLTRSGDAIVSPIPGVTRDRLYGTGYYEKEDLYEGFTLIDTGGFETDDFKFQPFSENLVWRQTELAIKDAHLVLFMFDGKNGLHFHDKDIIADLQKQGKRVLFLVNKVDGIEQKTVLWEFLSTGLTEDQLFPISAAHNRGVGELREAIKEELQAIRAESNEKLKAKVKSTEVPTKIAIIGRPNVGKSSLLNRIVGEERCLVSPIAGTTRDHVDTEILYHQKPYLLIDTAGIRRKTRIKEYLESQSVVRSLIAIDRADIVLLVIDAKEGLTDQDIRLVNLSIERFKPVLIIVNKWDLIPEKTTNAVRDYKHTIYNYALKDAHYIPIHFASCLENQRVHKIMGMVEEIKAQTERRVNTAAVNEALEKMVKAHTPHLIERSGKRFKFYYATQVEKSPPTIVIQCNRADDVMESYKRYIMKCFRQELGFTNIPFRIFYRNKKEKRAQA